MFVPVVDGCLSITENVGDVDMNEEYAVPHSIWYMLGLIKEE